MSQPLLFPQLPGLVISFIEMASTDIRKLGDINKYYQKAVKYASEALRFDEKGQREESIPRYGECLRWIETGVAVDIEGPIYNGKEWDDARAQQKKMLFTQVQVKERLYTLQGRSGSRTCDDDDDCGSTYSKDAPNNHVSLVNYLSENYELEGATELMMIPNGIEIFFVSADGLVGTAPPSYPTFLKILVDNCTENVILQVGEWFYPLNKSQTPVLKTRDYLYLFPNQSNNKIISGSIGIVIDSGVDKNLINAFENVLQTLAIFRLAIPEDQMDILDVAEERTSDKIASGIGQGAQWLSDNLRKASEITTNLVHQESSKLKNHAMPNETPTQVSPFVQSSLYYAHEVSKVSLRVSKFLVSGLCAVTSKVGQEIGPHVKEYGAKFMPSSLTQEDRNESVVDGAVKVAIAGVTGFSTVWRELEASGVAIADAISIATVENVELRYGKDAGTAAGHAMGSVVNVGKTAFNLDNLGFKAIAKRTAKDTGKAVLREYAHMPGKDSGI